MYVWCGSRFLPRLSHAPGSSESCCNDASSISPNTRPASSTTSPSRRSDANGLGQRELTGAAHQAIEYDAGSTRPECAHPRLPGRAAGQQGRLLLSSRTLSVESEEETLTKIGTGAREGQCLLPAEGSRGEFHTLPTPETDALQLKLRLQTLTEKKRVVQSRGATQPKISASFIALEEGFQQFESDLSKLQVRGLRTRTPPEADPTSNSSKSTPRPFPRF